MNRITTFFLLLLMVCVPTYGQLRSGASRPAARSRLTESVDPMARSRADLINATQAYRVSLEKLMELQERNVSRVAKDWQKRKELLALGAISKLEFEAAERTLADAKAELDKTQRQITEANHMIVEVQAMDQLARSAPGTYDTTGAMIRFNGSAGWSLGDAARVKAFFQTTFGHPLPISAFGQTAVHDRLHFDHRNAIDVALHPDSPEGQALLNYLRRAGIPFIAFRHEVPGSATGAHIHIGKPSIRLS